MVEAALIGFYNSETGRIFASTLVTSEGVEDTGRKLIDFYNKSYLAWQIAGMGKIRVLEETYDETYNSLDDILPLYFENISALLDTFETRTPENIYLFDGNAWFIADSKTRKFTDVITILSEAA